MTTCMGGNGACCCTTIGAGDVSVVVPPFLRPLTAAQMMTPPAKIPTHPHVGRGPSLRVSTFPLPDGALTSATAHSHSLLACRPPSTEYSDGGARNQPASGSVSSGCGAHPRRITLVILSATEIGYRTARNTAACNSSGCARCGSRGGVSPPGIRPSVNAANGVPPACRIADHPSASATASPPAAAACSGVSLKPATRPTPSATRSPEHAPGNPPPASAAARPDAAPAASTTGRPAGSSTAGQCERVASAWSPRTGGSTATAPREWWSGNRAEDPTRQPEGHPAGFPPPGRRSRTATRRVTRTAGTGPARRPTHGTTCRPADPATYTAGSDHQRSGSRR